MTNAIEASPLTYDAGLDFSYDSWTPGSTLTMTNVPWNNDYRDIVRFPTQGDLDKWIDSQLSPKITEMTLLKFGEPIRIAMGINKAREFNYARVSNPAYYGDDQRNYYYFILDAKYINLGVTELVLQVDAIQTFGYDVKFGNCYIERGHVGIANTNAFNHYGRDYLTVPEGMDVGSEYRIVHTEHEQIISSDGDADVDPGYDVLVCSTLDLTQDPGDSSDPSLDSAPGSQWQGLPSGAMFYLFRTGYDLRTFFLKFKSKPWITQGIISITLIPNMKRFTPGYEYGDNLSTDPDFKFYAADPNGGAPTPHTTKQLTNWRNSTFIANILGSQYSILKKFLTYPYMVIELTTYTGSATILKPESWQDPDAKIVELAAFMPPGQRIVAFPSRYNADDETLSSSESDQQDVNIYRDDLAEFINVAVTLDNFPQLPIVNDMAAAFLASNKHGLAWQESAADWGQQRALSAANTAAGQASMGMQTSNQLADIQTGVNSAQAAQQASTMTNQAVISGLTDIASGGAKGASLGPEGAVAGGIGGAISATGNAFSTANNINQLQQQTQIGNAGVQSSNTANVNNMSYARDTNLAFAQYAAGGDRANTIAGINAKIQDARLTQPSMSGQFGGDAFNIINGLFGYTLKWKMPSLNVLRQIGDYWLRYGYSIHQYGTIPDNWQVMDHFTYWKMTETYIWTAPIPESFKNIIRGIFERGVTVWAKPEYIGRTKLSDNKPLSGVSY